MKTLREFLELMKKEGQMDEIHDPSPRLLELMRQNFGAVKRSFAEWENLFAAAYVGQIAEKDTYPESRSPTGLP